MRLWLQPVLWLGLLGFCIGCGQSAMQHDSTPPASNAAGQDASAADASPAGHNYQGWWCTEHGVPEKDCSLCSKQAARRFKEKGDWCQEHNRAESQCFICDPSRAEKFAKLFEAKFGHAPPKPTQ